MNNTRRVMLLIDADNVSADVIEQAVQRTMAEHGAIHVRRAYCNAEAAEKHQALFNFQRTTATRVMTLSQGMLDALYNLAISLGAKCEGPAGERWPGFYAGYFRDPDGNKLNAFLMKQEG